VCQTSKSRAGKKTSNVFKTLEVSTTPTSANLSVRCIFFRPMSAIETQKQWPVPDYRLLTMCQCRQLRQSVQGDPCTPATRPAYKACFVLQSFLGSGAAGILRVILIGLWSLSDFGEAISWSNLKTCPLLGRISTVELGQKQLS